MVVESLAIEAGSLLVQHVARLWLDDRSARVSRESNLSDLIARSTLKPFQRRTFTRELERIGDTAAERLRGLCGREFRGMTENDESAVLHAVLDTLQDADLSDRALFRADLDAEQLATQLRSALPRVGSATELGDAGAAFYEALLQECCGCLVRIVQALPEFQSRAQTETLSRLTALEDRLDSFVADVCAELEQMPARVLDLGSSATGDSEFSRRYADYVSQTLDYVELFGVSVHQFRPHTALSVAYISLRATTTQKRRDRDLHMAIRGFDGTETSQREATMRAEAALAEHRLTLLRGDAGAGKSTLLRWLAITAARGAFAAELSDWNGVTPFLVKLRSYPEGPLPGPEEFIPADDNVIRATVPDGWAHRRLAAGAALLLVDGVDELPESRREKVRQWLRSLLATYPDIRVVVTSRPSAASARWLLSEGFGAVFLERMNPQDIAQLVRHWHQAMSDSPNLPCAASELHRHEAQLMGRLEAAPHLRAVATNPLIAAMLCALNLDRSRLPANRMELYSAALDMLLERRDVKREIPSFDDVRLEQTDKRRILQGLAVKLSMSDRAELPKDTAEACVALHLRGMRRVQAAPGSVLRSLLERSGVLREPVEGRVDFIHRTVQEYLTARQVIDESDIEDLVNKAHLDTWRETVIMAAGHANGPQRQQLVNGILRRIDSGERHARQLRLLLAACLETLEELPADLHARITACLDTLVPPRDQRAAQSLAAAGEAILDHLPDSLDGLSEKRAAATVRTAWLVNGPNALDALERYRLDPRERVQAELIEAWQYFDPEEYARRVLADAPLRSGGQVRITQPRLLASLGHLSSLRRLYVREITAPNFAFLKNVHPLIELNANVDNPSDVHHLGLHSSSLEDLSITSRFPIHSLALLGEFLHLSHLLLDIPRVADLEFLADVPPLNDLILLGGAVGENMSLSPIRGHRASLEVVGISESASPIDVAIFRDMPNLRVLLIVKNEENGFSDASLAEITQHNPQLTGLYIYDSPNITHLHSIEGLPLRHLNIVNCVNIHNFNALLRQTSLEILSASRSGFHDLDLVRNMHRLEILHLDGNPVTDLSPLAELSRLEFLSIEDVPPGLDLAPLSGQRNLTIWIRAGQIVRNRRLLHRTVRVRERDF